MDDQRLGVADVGQQREDLDVVDEPATGLDPALHAERDDAAEAAGQVLLGLLVAGMRLEARVADTQVTSSRVSSQRAMASAFSLWRVIRSGSVSRPWRNRNALNGLSAAPMSRRPWTRSLRMNARLPNAAV